MASIVHSIQTRTSTFRPSRSPSLPVSQPDPPSDQGIRRRLSSLSLQIQPNSSSSAYAWALHRSRSLSSMGETAGTSLKRWWESGWGWILSRKPGFAADLELNQEEKRSIGSHYKGTWKHVFYKIRTEFRRILRSDNEVLPMSYRYDSKTYGHAALRRSATLH